MRVIDEGIKEIKKYEEIEPVTKEEIKKELDFIVSKILDNLEEFTYQFPSPASKNNIYFKQDNIDWTSGFWTGMLWLAYEYTDNEKILDVAKIQCEDFKNRIEKEIDVEHHDLGFLYSLSCVAGYKLTGDLRMKESAIMAADKLIQRYKEKGEFIQAWGAVDDPKAYRLIIDCMLNIPLLYWAAEVTGDKKYYDIAYKHAKTSVSTVIREDSSTYHTYYFEPATGEPVKGVTHQGFSDNSTWARGQAWGIYGSILSYIYTKDNSFLEEDIKVTNYFLNRLPVDFIPYWDLVFQDGSGEERDTSAAAIATCGMLELIKHIPNKEVYLNACHAVVRSLIDQYTTKNMPASNGILLHGVYAKPMNAGVDECTIWGDYFYMETLMRMYKDWKLYW